MLRRFRSLKASGSDLPVTIVEPVASVELEGKGQPIGDEAAALTATVAPMSGGVALHGEAAIDGPPTEAALWSRLQMGLDRAGAMAGEGVRLAGGAADLASTGFRQAGSVLSTAGGKAATTSAAAAKGIASGAELAFDVAQAGSRFAGDVASTAAGHAAGAARSIVDGATVAASFVGDAATVAGQTGASFVDHAVVKPVLAVGRGVGTVGEKVIVEPARATRRFVLTIVFAVCGAAVLTAFFLAVAAAFFFSRG